MAKVSVIVPVYNVEKYLRECLDSIINQTLKDIEIICVNDGSKDNSLNILREYENNDKRIKIIDKENGGYGRAMNVGLNNATGEYIGIVEPDDYIELDMYETLYNEAIKHDLDMIKADFHRFTGKGKRLKKIYFALDEEGKYYNRVIKPIDELPVFNLVMNTWSGIYKRSFIEEHNIRHNETPGASFQDNGFWFQTFAFANRAYFINKPFYMNRRDNENSSVKDKGKVYAMSVEYDYILDFLNRNPDLKSKLMGVYYYKRFQNYSGTIHRINKKFRKEFIEFFHNEFNELEQNKELDSSCFSDYEKYMLGLLINNPDKFYRDTLKIYTFKESIFSLKNRYINHKHYKIICILGIKLKIIDKKRSKNA